MGLESGEGLKSIKGLVSRDDGAVSKWIKKPKERIKTPESKLLINNLIKVNERE